MRYLQTKICCLGVFFTLMVTGVYASPVLPMEQLNLRIEGLKTVYSPMETLAEFTATIQPSVAGSVSSWKTAPVKVSLYRCDSPNPVDAGPYDDFGCNTWVYKVDLTSDFVEDNSVFVPGQRDEIFQTWDHTYGPPDEMISLNRYEKYSQVYDLSGEKFGDVTGDYHLSSGYYVLQFEYSYQYFYAHFDKADHEGDDMAWARHYFHVTTKNMEGGSYAAIAHWLSVLEDENVSDFTLDSAWDALRYYTEVRFLHHTRYKNIEERRRAAKEYRLWWKDKKDQLVLTSEEDGSEYLNDPSIKSGFFIKVLI